MLPGAVFEIADALFVSAGDVLPAPDGIQHHFKISRDLCEPRFVLLEPRFVLLESGFVLFKKGFASLFVVAMHSGHKLDGFGKSFQAFVNGHRRCLSL